LLALTVACALVAVAVAGLMPGASAQQKSPAGSKQPGSAALSTKRAPGVRSRAKFKDSMAKSAAAPGGEAVPLALGCAKPDGAITLSQTVNGSLVSGDCTLSDGSFFDAYTFSGTANQQVVIRMSSGQFDTLLFLMRPGETSLRPLDSNDPFQSDDDGGGTNSLISVTLPTTGTYTIIANAFYPPNDPDGDGGSGSYTLSLAPPCTPVQTSITPTVGGAVNVTGTFASTDCTLDDGSFFDVYTFSGTAGQQVAVTMNSSFDNFLFLVAPDGDELARDDDGGGGTNARIPAGSGFARLPQTGTYRIVANSALPNVTGSYTVSLAVAASPCPSSPISFGASVNDALATTDCRLPFDSSLMDVYTFNASAGQTVNITMNSTAFDAFLFLLAPDGTVLASDDNGGGGTNARIPSSDTPGFTGTLPTTGTYTIYANSAAAGLTGAYTLSLTGTGGTSCDVTIYPPVQPFTQGGGTGRFTVFPVGTCSWTASTSTPWITINSPTAATAGTGRVRYTVAPNNTAATRTGSIVVGTRTYVVTQTSAATTPQVQFSNATYSVNEGDASKSITITVSRIGDTAGAATIEYRTVDDPTAIPCNPADTPAAQRGKALARCDYSTNLDTLTFDIGQTVKTFTIPLINDAHVEGNETFQIALQNAQGAAAGSQQTATVTIVDDDAAQSTTNPINQTPLFIRMQYLDFLTREPEPGEPWSAVINGCPNPFNRPNNDPSANCDRIKVSSAFFGSDEFKLKGFFVFLYYKVSFGSQATPNFVPQYDQLMPDMRRVTGASTEERVDKTFNFAEDWVTRPAFVARYGPKNNAQFVDELLANVGATLASADPVSGETRNSLVAALDASTKTRAQVLRIIVESREVNNVQTNHAFGAMQYYGYLRRTPEPGGYNDWLNTINPPTSADPRDMVNGFLNSDEYFLRFGPNVRQ
jgi:hypothetical protein